MIEAWFSASEMIASSSPSSVSNRPPLASKQERVEDRVLHAEEGRDPRLELLVLLLRAADEAHRGHAVAVAVERRLGRRRAAPRCRRGRDSCWRRSSAPCCRRPPRSRPTAARRSPARTCRARRTSALRVRTRDGRGTLCSSSQSWIETGRLSRGADEKSMKNYDADGRACSAPPTLAAQLAQDIGDPMMSMPFLAQAPSAPQSSPVSARHAVADRR